MITKDGLLASAENESTYFIDFNTKCSRYGTNCVYCFVENYDQCFYLHRVNDILNRYSVGIPCDGKKNVLSVFALISSKPEYDKYTVRYFVDADFDDNSKVDPKVYITECYSVENYFLDSSVVSRVLENEYKIRPSADDGKHELCLELFNAELTAFHNEVLLLNSWYRTVKTKGLSKDFKICYLKTLSPDMFDLTIGAIQAKYSIKDIENMYPCVPKCSSEELEESEKWLLSDVRRFRGKYEMQFLCKFFEFLNTDARGAKKYTVNRDVVNTDLKKAISTFDPYVYTSARMREYIVKGVRDGV